MVILSTDLHVDMKRFASITNQNHSFFCVIFLFSGIKMTIQSPSSLFLCFFTISLCLQLVLCQFWPKPESLLFFTPLDAKNELMNIAKNVQPNYIYSPLLETSKNGPFGIADSSYTVDYFTNSIGYYYPQPSFPSFTFSTYFYVSGNYVEGGIFFIFGGNSPNRFSVVYKGNSLEIHRFDSSNHLSIASFEVENFFTNGWTWICFTYDDSTKTVILYNQLGIPIRTVQNFPILNNENTYFYLGYGRDGSSIKYMTNGDAIACTMVYTQVLAPREIGELPKVCKFKGQNPAAPEPWPEDEHLIGLWPLSNEYKLYTANKGAEFKPVCFHCKIVEIVRFCLKKYREASSNQNHLFLDHMEHI